ncbi:ATP-binding protein [Amycolatopsis nalaikhensis]|uniref:ATP-binding protein n=1 Tax=Amycolatopsis nalaikhensis TaxID=715472 RepID=A0ABY8Y288_9PSEU|nr:ATP-binding protein [Amycolatopsis sp. 2-2]WIV61982.1 ATP-binding protein [Amycolatopsis sp. 2-2]
MFKPFVRAAPRTRGGHGIGMAIIRAVTDAHGGTVSARLNPGGGLTVTVAFTEAENIAQRREIPGPAEWDTAGRARPGV